MESTQAPTPRPATPPGLAVYAIGDIHGRRDLLVGALAAVRAAARNAVASQRVAVVFLGDYIDRGPASRAVIEDLIAFRDEGCCETVFLRGNHEQVLLDVFDGVETAGPWLEHGGRATLDSYGVAWSSRDTPKDLWAQLDAAIPADHIEFLRATTLTAVYGDYLFVHAGLRPDRLIEEQSPADLLWFRYYDDEPPLHGATVIHGHSHNRLPVLGRHRVGIDTQAYASGALTLLKLHGTQKVFQRIVATQAEPTATLDIWPELDSAYRADELRDRAPRARRSTDSRRRAWAVAAALLAFALALAGAAYFRGDSWLQKRDAVAGRDAATREPTASAPRGDG